MSFARQIAGLLTAAGLVLSGCGQTSPEAQEALGLTDDDTGRSTLFDLFTNVDDPEVTLEVNKYIWVAAQDVLSFMPVEAVDPFSGVLVMGYGVPPGGGRAYRATVYVQDPALDARSLNLAMQTRSGPVDAETVRAVEDAILTRARQLRIRDLGL